MCRLLMDMVIWLYQIGSLVLRKLNHQINMCMILLLIQQKTLFLLMNWLFSTHFIFQESLLWVPPTWVWVESRNYYHLPKTQRTYHGYLHGYGNQRKPIHSQQDCLPYQEDHN